MEDEEVSDGNCPEDRCISEPKYTVYPCLESCDASSSTYGHWKTALLKLVEKGHPTVTKICSTFNNSQSSHMEIAEAGHKLFCIMYGNLIIYHHYLKFRNFHRISS